MRKKLPEVMFYCKKCGADVQESLIDKEKSNENWSVCLEECPFCGSKIQIKLSGDY